MGPPMVLMVAEKPSIAETLAKALSRERPSQRKGVSPAVPVFEFQGDFQGKSAWIRITSCAGHVYSVDFPPDFQNWDRTDPLSLFNAPVMKNEANPKLRMPKHFQTEAKGCQHLVLWLDCDREGENICFEVMKNVVPQLPDKKNVWRAKFSSLTPSDLQKAYRNLGYPNENEAKAVDCRQELDLKVGVAFTRFQTRFFQGKYGDLDSSLVSYGPCQTPTLWFCVKRHTEIQSFEPEPYYCVELGLSPASMNGSMLWLEWERGRVFDAVGGRIFLEKVENGGPAKVVSVTEKQEKRARPQALNTVAMLKMASTNLGIGPQQAMQIAERLYLSGFITYPRTETNKYPGSFDLAGTVREQCSQRDWGSYAKDLIASGLAKPRDGNDAGDHPPITPVRPATEDLVGGYDAWRLYEMVTRNFLASVSPDCKFMRTKITVEVGGERFSVAGRRLLDPGFTSVLRSGEMQDVYVPEVAVGEQFAVSKVSLGSYKTGPPPYLSEADLLGLMEKFGIGTDASMATHINNICDRNYVQLVEGASRRLKPTKLGIVLVRGYQLIDPELVVPQVRSDIESQCNLVAKGQADLHEVLKHSLAIFKAKYDYFVNNIARMDQIFESNFTSLAQTGKRLCRCGICKRFMNYIDKRPQRLFCQHCDVTYNLPQTGAVKLYKEIKCPLDDFELVLVSHPGAGAKSYPLCPMCYNNPPFEDRKAMACTECLHPTCKHSLTAVGVCSCPQEGCSGTLCLDEDSKPKWHMDCNNCNFQVKLFQDCAHKISVLDKHCEDCDACILGITFTKGKAPAGLPENVSGCLICDETLNKLVEGAFSRIGRVGGRGRKGKGKGKRGGKGKGKKNVDPRMTFDGF